MAGRTVARGSPVAHPCFKPNNVEFIYQIIICDLNESLQIKCTVKVTDASSRHSRKCSCGGGARESIFKRFIPLVFCNYKACFVPKEYKIKSLRQSKILTAGTT